MSKESREFVNQSVMFLIVTVQGKFAFGIQVPCLLNSIKFDMNDTF